MRSPVNEVDILVRFMNNDKLKELIETVTEMRMREMGKEVDKMMREKVETVNESVDNVRKTYLDLETNTRGTRGWSRQRDRTLAVPEKRENQFFSV